MAGEGKPLTPRAPAARDEPTALDLLEEGAHLLRRLPPAAVATYYAGTVPMVLGLLYFVADMARGAQARAHAPEAALGLVLLFTWMKTAQAVAAEHALAVLEQRAPAVLRPRAWAGLALRQLRVHAWALVALPVASVLVVPFAWVYSFFQNATALGVSSPRRLGALSWAQARRWPLQNHRLLAVQGLVGLFAFLNVAIATYMIPSLLRSLFGLDNLFATSGWSMFNTTFLTVAGGLTFLALDPWFKATYVLRCFHGHARHTGVDLLVRARAALARPRAAILGLGLLVAGGATSEGLRAAEIDTDNPVAVEQGIVPGARLDAALDQVLTSPEYAWRLPREADADEPRGLVGRFVESMQDLVTWLKDALVRLLRKLFTREYSEAEAQASTVFAGLASVVMPVLIGLLIVGILWLAWRWWADGRKQAVPPSAAVVTPVLDDENVTADQLPEDEWLRLGRDLLARGELRLALRAFFLASLAALGARGLLVLARHKSNRDYERELARRGGAAGLTAAFADNRRLLERAWYGRDPAVLEEVRRCENNVRTFQGGGA